MLNSLFQALMLAQTAQEKRMTYYGVLFFGFFLFVLFLDTMAKGKFIPKKGPMKTILIFMCVIAGIVAILLHFVYK
mgnify:CR=1 FL=1